MVPKLIPELDVADLNRSLAFYVGVAGFRFCYGREEEQFAYLDLDGVHLMLQEAVGPGRRFRTASLEAPYGRGINLQIKVDDVDTLYRQVLHAGFVPVISLEDR
jgi:catechol 2,3-dioxygenase-like lactoylglutathione lyase family enzyme